MDLSEDRAQQRHERKRTYSPTFFSVTIVPTGGSALFLRARFASISVKSWSVRFHTRTCNATSPTEEYKVLRFVAVCDVRVTKGFNSLLGLSQ